MTTNSGGLLLSDLTRNKQADKEYVYVCLYADTVMCYIHSNVIGTNAGRRVCLNVGKAGGMKVRGDTKQGQSICGRKARKQTRRS